MSWIGKVLTCRIGVSEYEWGVLCVGMMCRYDGDGHFGDLIFAWVYWWGSRACALPQWGHGGIPCPTAGSIIGPD